MGKAAKDKDATAAAGAPAKPKAAKGSKDKTDKSSADDSEATIFAYLRKQNRPYSPIDVFNNLGGACVVNVASTLFETLIATIPKTQVVKALTNLFNNGQIHGKCNAKAWVYITKQDDLESPSQADLDVLDAKVAELVESISTIKERIKQTSHELAATTSTPSDVQLQDFLPRSQNEASVAKDHLAKLQSGSKKLITPEETKQLNEDTEKASAIERRRRREFNDLFGTLCDATNLKKHDLAEEAGVTL